MIRNRPITSQASLITCEFIKLRTVSGSTLAMANRIDSGSEDEKPVKKKFKRLIVAESSADEDEEDAIESS